MGELIVIAKCEAESELDKGGHLYGAKCELDKGSDLDVGAECELEGTEWQHERDLGKGGHLDASGQCEPEAAKSEHEGELDKGVNVNLRLLSLNIKVS